MNDLLDGLETIILIASVQEGLSLYPEYKLIMKEGNEYALLQAAQAGVKGMDEHLERMRTDPKEILKEGSSGLLEALKEPGTFTLAYAPEVV